MAGISLPNINQTIPTGVGSSSGVGALGGAGNANSISPSGNSNSGSPPSAFNALSQGDPSSQGSGGMSSQLMGQVLMMLSSLMQQLAQMLGGGQSGQQPQDGSQAGGGQQGSGASSPPGGGGSGSGCGSSPPPAGGGDSASRPPAGGGSTPSTPPAGGGDNASRPPAGGGSTPSTPPAGGGDNASSPPAGGGSTPPTPPAGGGDNASSPPAGGGSTPPTPSAGGGDSASSPPAGGGSTPPPSGSAPTGQGGGHMIGQIQATNPSKYDKQINDAIQKYGGGQKIDPNIIKGMIWQESKGDPMAAGSLDAQGSKGLMQVTADNVKQYGFGNQNDPAQSIGLGVKMYADALKHNNGDATLALGEYNQGPGAKSSSNAQTYAQKVQEWAKDFGQNPKQLPGGTKEGQLV
jgi:hypothetical protein